MLLLALLLQTAPATVQTPPDIELNIRATAREVRIVRKGEARLELRAGPDGGGNVVRVEAPDAAGRTQLRNAVVNVHAEARIADPLENRTAPETPAPQ
jgi:hypothetical protein